ncbi:MAG TPA: ATP-binding protein [Luteimonas sp.]|nr:ATP-binding protein [Luteimonas sp.]
MPLASPLLVNPGLRLPALALAIVLIVVAPFALLRGATARSDAALAAVSHTRQVEATVHALAGDVRNLEAAALAVAEGVDVTQVRARILYSKPRIEPAMLELERLTRDNPDQQVRIGALETSMRLRVQAAEQLLRDGRAATVVDIANLVTRFPVHNLVEEIISEERALLAERTAEAERTRRQATVLAWGAMLAQLLLLGGLAWLATRLLSQRLAAQGDLQRAEARAGAVLDTVREPIVLLDRQQRVVMHNAAFGELYGVDGDVRATPLADLGDGAWREEEILRRLRDVLSRGRELWDFERAQRTADGADRVMLINARAMTLPDSEHDVVLVTASDVTAQKASERYIRELNQQLEGKVDQVSDVNRELEAFSYSVSHDLRAPLRHIAGFADKLGRQLGDGADDKSRHYLNVIESSAKRMSTLIDDLLVYSRLGRSAIRLQAVDMQSMVADTRAMLDANARTDYPDHRIDWDVGALPMLVGDENMLRQVWLNLLGNAVKYSSRSEPARITVTHAYDDAGREHHFSVQDNGAGFDMAYSNKLFGVFQRLHAASEFSGTGIGLASVKRVLLRHGGRVWAESRLGEGATFHFVLPTTLDPPAKGAPTA